MKRLKKSAGKLSEVVAEKLDEAAVALNSFARVNPEFQGIADEVYTLRVKLENMMEEQA